MISAGEETLTEEGECKLHGSKSIVLLLLIGMGAVILQGCAVVPRTMHSPSIQGVVSAGGERIPYALVIVYLEDWRNGAMKGILGPQYGFSDTNGNYKVPGFSRFRFEFQRFWDTSSRACVYDVVRPPDYLTQRRLAIFDSPGSLQMGIDEFNLPDGIRVNAQASRAKMVVGLKEILPYFEGPKRLPFRKSDYPRVVMLIDEAFRTQSPATPGDVALYDRLIRKFRRQ